MIRVSSPFPSAPSVMLAVVVALAGCSGAQNALNPAGVQAGRIYSYFWFILILATLVYLIVMGIVLYAAFRRRFREEAEGVEDAAVEAEKTRKMTRGLAIGVGATTVILFVLLTVDMFTGHAIASLARQEEEALVINVNGHQWWWEVQYDDPVPSRKLTTANEIHIPVGRPVRIRLTSTDVIHSFWVPNLHGKKDLIPGHLNEIWLRADEPGVYRGQCAEFCGHQHAKMGLLVIAQPPAEFAAWYEQQLQPARPPADSVQARGQEVFLAHACVMCHRIRGTLAGGSVAPDLTHIGSRRTLGSAILPNTRGHLGGWITDPQRIKPGTRMPPNQIEASDLQALLTYLESLK